MCEDKIVMKKHFVVFYSPGTFVHEESSIEIEKWDVEQAMKMADSITERNAATPFGFYFTTWGRSVDDLDSKEIDHSPMYYLGGKIETLEEIEARNDPDEQILIANMKSGDYKKVIVNTNSWKSTLPFREKDILVDYTPPKKAKAT
jgi:hypothetical protein